MRYNNIKKIVDSNYETINSLNIINIPIDKFNYKEISYNNERLDALADKYYGDGSLWDIIALFNNITNPLKIDKNILLIPTSYRDVQSYIENINYK